MSGQPEPGDAGDRWNLARFLKAQEEDYAIALGEIRAGRKRSHWMWYVFPQMDGLGESTTAKFYAIKGRDEALAHLGHPVLGARLVECAEAVLAIEGRPMEVVFGWPDVLKLRSSMTLFEAVSGVGSVFERVLAKHYGGERDEKTLALLT